MRKIILDVDTGYDDAVAIVLALASRNLEVLGISTVNGNRPVEESTENTLRVIDALGSDCPVYMGISEPLVACLNPHRKPGFPYSRPIDLHGDYLCLPQAVSRRQETHAVTWLIDVLEKSEEPITLVGLAPLTNLAMAFRIAPKVVERVEELWLLGGAFQCGNVTPVAEFNFWADPEAAKIVIQQPIRKHIVTINAAYDTRLTRDECSSFKGNNRAAGAAISAILSSTVKDRDSLVVYDAVTVCALLADEVAEFVPMRADIDISGGVSDGQFVAVPCEAAQTDLFAALHADKAAFMKTIDSILQGEL